MGFSAALLGLEGDTALVELVIVGVGPCQLLRLELGLEKGKVGQHLLAARPCQLLRRDARTVELGLEQLLTHEAHVVELPGRRNCQDARTPAQWMQVLLLRWLLQGHYDRRAAASGADSLSCSNAEG